MNVNLAMKGRLGDRRGIMHGLEGMAEVTQGRHQPGRAARLFGATSSLRESIGSPLPSAVRREFDEPMAERRQISGDEAFTVAWDAGRAMTLGQAVAYALADEDADD